MKTYYRSGSALSDAEQKDIWDLLIICDNDFFPPLSQRNSSYQKDFFVQQTKSADGPKSYYNEMIGQEFLLTYEEKRLIAFMTFRVGYTYDALGEDYNPSLYMTTACVEPAYRNRGIMNSLYEKMEVEMTEQFHCPVVTTRTWSTNESQMSMFPVRGYKTILVLKNDRGKGVDTVYFGKRKNG